MHCIGWDLGGAHLKVACVDAVGKVIGVNQYYTPLWDGTAQWLNVLRDHQARLPAGPLSHIVTMTAELVDSFDSRASGVRDLLQLFGTVFPDHVRVFAGAEGIITLSRADQYLDAIASANWYATARYVASRIGDEGVLLDIGSTTTDIVRFSGERLLNRGYRDQERLRYNELVYTGVIRTPIMTLAHRVPFAGEWQDLTAEYFANCADIYRITRELPDGHDLTPSADGREKTFMASMVRLARMLGTDYQPEGDQQAWIGLAHYLSGQQVRRIADALACVVSFQPTRRLRLVGAGCGRFLVPRLLDHGNFDYMDFSSLADVAPDLRPLVAQCAPAVAVAYLLHGHIQ